MIERIPYGNFKTKTKSKHKKQIILCHSSREVNEFLTSLKFRSNGKHQQIPHFVITRDGKVLQLLETKSKSSYFKNSTMDKNSIVVCLENLGWLMKKPLSDSYLNWIGNIYKQEVCEKKWRDYSMWHPYTEVQLRSVADLCGELCEEFSIPKKFVGHNTRVENIQLFDGITTKSNYDVRHTDLSPAFDFQSFVKFLENEQIRSEIQ
jgi:N-acetyl-anhydromuramyl-L-alanine amidase AmpD